MEKYFSSFSLYLILLFLLPLWFLMSFGSWSVLILVPFYIIVLISLIILHLSKYLSKSKNMWQDSIKQNFFSRYNIPWIFILPLLIIKTTFLIRQFDIIYLIRHFKFSYIIELIPYFLVLLINKKFSNSKSIYKILMLVFLIINTTFYWYIYFVPFAIQSLGYYSYLYWPLMWIISIILLIIVWWTSQKYQISISQEFINNQWDQISNNNSNNLYWALFFLSMLIGLLRLINWAWWF